jgi:phage terminase large subunit GpA-like protein
MPRRRITRPPRDVFFSTLSPPPAETLSMWADRRRILAASGSAEAGPYRAARTPALVEIADAISDPTIEEIVVMKSAQAGLTELLVNAILRAIDVAPVPTLYVMPTLEMAQALMRTRVRPALELMPELAGKVRGRTMMHLDVDGAPIEVVGGRSTSALSSRAVGQLFGDELDRLEHDLDGEGDPWQLAQARTATFATRKIVAVSTPTITGASRIESLFLASDQRRLHVECPSCRARIVPTIAHLVEREGEVHWQCPGCSQEVDEAGRMALITAGEWRPTAASPIRGYHLWALYSPWTTMAEILKKRAEAAHSPELAQTFHNLVLGEPWSPPATTIETSDLLALREDFGDLVPAGVRFITLGVDCQDDQLVGLLVGWGEHEETWLLGVVAFVGEPSIDAPWDEMSELLGMPFPSAVGGAHKIGASLVDSGGHHTDRVYHMTARLRKRGYWVYACKGYAGTRPIIAKSKTEKGTALHFMVGVDGAKAALYARLKRIDGAPSIHIPTSFDESLCSQLTSEQMILDRNKWGRVRQVWRLPRGRANELLDCLVYAYGAMRWHAPTPERFTLTCMQGDALRLRQNTGS